MGRDHQGTAEPIRLNLGCGHRKMAGFINVDLAGNWSDIKPDVCADITQPLPFDNSYADEIHAYHVIEHLYRWRVPKILAQWINVLKPGGLLVLEMPCIDKVMGYVFACMEQGKSPPPRMFYWALYGDPGYECEEMVHRWCYGTIEATELLRDAGLVDIEIKPPQTHVPARDMRIEGHKP